MAKIPLALPSRGAIPDLLCNWLFTVPILLLVALLATHQIDLYAPTVDEIHSIIAAGGGHDGPYTLQEVLKSLIAFSSDHSPGYFMLVGLWGNFISFDLAIVRTLSIFFHLLALCALYRLGKDFISPLAGAVALVLAASNAILNFYSAHARMYALLLLTASIVLWLYLKLITRQNQDKPTTYLALVVAVYALANTHP